MDPLVSSRVLKRAEKELAQTKVILRHLPPDYTEERLKVDIELPAWNYFAFVPGNPDLGIFGCSRAYVNFKSFGDIVSFRDSYDGLVLETEKGVKYRVVVELAPCQIIPKGRVKPDHRTGTIFEDPEYKEFLEHFEKEVDPLPSVDVKYLYEIEKMKVESLQATPLTDYLRGKYTVSSRGHRGSGQRNKVLYAAGSSRRKNRDKVKELKGGGKGKNRKEKDIKKGKGAESRRDTDSVKVTVVEKPGRSQNGFDGDVGGSSKEKMKPPKSVKTDSSPGQRRSKPDQPLYVPGSGAGGSKRGGGDRRTKDVPTDESKRKDRSPKNYKDEDGRKKGGGRDGYSGHYKYGRSQYNDRHDNHYAFKEENDSYQGPDYSSSTDRRPPRSAAKNRSEDYKDDKRSGGHYYGRGRNHDRYDDSFKGGGYRSAHK